MLKSIEGFYSNGRVELTEAPQDIEEMRVIVTFLPKDKSRDLNEFGIGEAQAADLRARLHTFEDDWNRPDMEGYDAL